MIDAWFDAIDRATAVAFPLERIEAMKIRERIAALVMFRLELVHPHKEALRRALAILAQPQNLALGARLGWRAADRMWRIAGDRATDFNHYSKRALLLGVYGSIALVYLDDDSDGLAATPAFLDRRPRLAPPPHRRADADRKGQGELAGQPRTPPLPQPLLRAGALPGRLEH